MGRRTGDRESQKTCRTYSTGDDGKIAGLRYEDTESLKVKVNWVQALSPIKGSRLFIWGMVSFSGFRQFGIGGTGYVLFGAGF